MIKIQELPGAMPQDPHRGSAPGEYMPLGGMSLGGMSLGGIPKGRMSLGGLNLSSTCILK